MIINSLLDTDWYKMVMGQVVYFLYPDLWVKYKFINRSDTWFSEGFDIKLKEEINHLSTLRLTSEEKEWLSKQIGMNKSYVEWFNNYSFNPNQVKVELKDKKLSLEIEGKWKETIYWEVPLLAIISELYYKETQKFQTEDFIVDSISRKSLKLANVPYVDFGTRRRFSYDVQDKVVYYHNNTIGLSGKSFLGTSNPHFAMKHHLTPIGTTAHECIMAMSALYGVKEANKKWIEDWRFIYGNNYNVALTDTFTTDYFFKTVPQKYLVLVEGLRQDSGNPIEIGYKIIKSWKERGISPKEKKIIFSDNLNVEKAYKIYNTFKDKTNVFFGIGTNLTNDVGFRPLNIVIKLDSVLIKEYYGIEEEQYGWNWEPVIKLSDDKRKYTGEEDCIRGILKTVDYGNK